MPPEENTPQQIAEVVEGIFRETFREPNLVISRDMTAEMVTGWDSLSNIIMITNLEKAYGIQFGATEIMALRNVGELLDLTRTKIEAGS